ncbi:MAG: ThuA domain-containing protein [Bacteroidales bacterium]|nr:ThuA domain-containing protein [Bacteroidales bacterium]
MIKYKIAFCITFFLSMVATSQTLLLLTETNGWNHKTKEASLELFTALANENQYQLQHTDSSETNITKANLKKVAILILANTTANIFTQKEENLVQNFVENGGAIFGIHAASDTEYDWLWYQNAISAHFTTHAPDGERSGRIIIEDRSHPAVKVFSDTNNITEEWYSFNQSPRDKVTVLASVVENSYLSSPDEMGLFDKKMAMGDHPIIWHKKVGKGIVYYTALGHNPDNYLKPYFKNHILASLNWIIAEQNK